MSVPSSLGRDHVLRLPPSTRLLPGEGDRRILASEGAVIALHYGHDANIVIAKHGRVQCVLELERLFGERYCHPAEANHKFQPMMREALIALRDGCICEDGACPTEFEEGVVMDLTFFKSAVTAQTPLLVEDIFGAVGRWRQVHHHEGHALLGYHASPFNSALVVSFDLGGDDGHFNVFLGQGGELQRLANQHAPFGEFYCAFRMLLPDVAGKFFKITHQLLCERWRANELAIDSGWFEFIFYHQHVQLDFAGKLMGYSGLRKPGRLSAEEQAEVEEYFDIMFHENPSRDLSSPYRLLFPPHLLALSCASSDGQMRLAAEVQFQFQRRLLLHIQGLLKQLRQASIQVEGIVLTGGCALNVLANQLIRENLTQGGLGSSYADHPWDVYVAPAPNDAGLAVGGVWAVQPPRVPQALQYLGLPLFDAEILPMEAERRGARRLSELGGVEFLADLLTQNRSAGGKPIIAVVRGRQEFGPRALGHRSLLAVPDTYEIKRRLNRLKFRQWYRPVAPMIAVEALEEVFGRVVLSTSMEFAPRVRKGVQGRFPALAHYDGTARHQSVSREDEPWIHSLLLAVGRITGLAALINTSFNSRGKPIVNTVSESLEMLDTLPDLDFLVIEGWLFQGPEAGPQNTKTLQSLPEAHNTSAKHTSEPMQVKKPMPKQPEAIWSFGFS